VIRSRQALPSVTLIAVAGVEINKALYALWRSSLNIDFGDAILVSDKVVKNRLQGLRVESTDGFSLNSLDAYNEYCVFQLYKHVKTEFALLVQADGYVINPKKWQENFLEYDYIGAPWRVVNTAYIDPFGRHQRVGNGGFSLRSKRLLETPLHTHIEWNVNQGSFYKHLNSNSQSEDGIICVHNRHVYEQAGNIFAPLDVALHFSCEQKVAEYKSVKTFGFHKHFPKISERICDYFFRIFFTAKYMLV